MWLLLGRAALPSSATQSAQLDFAEDSLQPIRLSHGAASCAEGLTNQMGR